MAKKKQNKSKIQSSEANLKAGHYTPSMVEFLGYDTIKSVYDATLTAAEEAQAFSAEVKTKGLQTAGLLGAIIIGLVTAVCTINALFVKIVVTVLAAVLLNALRGIVANVIYRKENMHRGNTQSRMLSEQMISALQKVDKGNRAAFVLASTLKSLEKSVKDLDAQTEEKQKAYQKEIDTLTNNLTIVFVLASAFAILFYFSLPVY